MNDETRQKRDEMADKQAFEKGNAHTLRTEPAWHYSLIDFKTGFDAGYALAKSEQDEALSKAVECLEKIASPLGPHPDVCSLARSMEDAAQVTLAEIRKIQKGT